MKKKNYGTRQWADYTVNYCSGCSNNCRYCYAKARAVNWFKQLTAAQWPAERIRMHDVQKKRKREIGRGMIPSTHDITPNNLGAGITVIDNLLEAGNSLLIVSKPHLDCIKAICENFIHYRDLFEMDEIGNRQYRVIFRFSIGACDDRLLSYWEPNAPNYDERKASLEYAYDAGFQTGVSAEPMLDAYHIDDLIDDLSPYVTDSIWIGKMNHFGYIAKNADATLKKAINDIKHGQSDANIKSIYQRHRSNPLIQWKDSILDVVR